MRSTAAKVLKADKPAPKMRELARESNPVADEVTKIDAPKAEKAAKPSKKPVKAAPLSAKAEVAPKLGLKVSAGLNMGTIYPVKKRRNIIGRRVDAAFPVQDERASRDHAAIEFKKGHFMLTDLGSTNGTYLNNKSVKIPTFIKEGDHIRVGSSVFVVELMNEKSPEMVEKWSSMTTIVPRAQVLAKAKETMSKPILSRSEETELPRWMHLTKTFAKGHQKHLHQARMFGIALSVLMVAAAILTSWH